MNTIKFVSLTESDFIFPFTWEKKDYFFMEHLCCSISWEKLI